MAQLCSVLLEAQYGEQKALLRGSHERRSHLCIPQPSPRHSLHQGRGGFRAQLRLLEALQQHECMQLMPRRGGPSCCAALLLRASQSSFAALEQMPCTKPEQLEINSLWYECLLLAAQAWAFHSATQPIYPE